MRGSLYDRVEKLKKKHEILFIRERLEIEMEKERENTQKDQPINNEVDINVSK